MNRRTFLASLAATSLTPLVPEQVFASGGIVNPEHCGFVIGEFPSEFPIRLESPALYDARRIGIDPISIFFKLADHRLFYGDGADRKSGINLT